MHAGEQFHGGCFAATLEAGDGMAITKFFESPVSGAQPSVCTVLPGSDGLLDESVQAGVGTVGHACQADAANAGTVFFGGDYNQGLANAIAASPRTHTANESLVNFDRSVEAIPAWTHHGPAQLMQPKPGRLVAAQPQDALEAQGTGARLLTRNQPHRAKPHPQRQMGPLKDRSRSHCRLAAALLAGPTVPTVCPAGLTLASRTSKTGTPTQSSQILAAGVLGRKSLLQFKHRLRIILFSSL